ncbi:Protein-tyrosine kinase 6 [Geodia barretti]|uniref:Protein-tyrosine kinase 6 n=2 Tax=Geodia barretti TaxID=519541 RepID=A0AA35RZT9_GEOBA|nr:Protein-tyrosine kinase 6 [Geodia barretti]
METNLNRFVLLEVVKVLESSKVQETILAQKVKAMLFQNIPPTTEVNEPFLTIECGKYKTVDVDRNGAERLLGNDDCSEGAFLIRDGQNARCERVLSVRLVEKEVGHFRIYKDQGSRYFLHGTSKFESLDELIDNYKEEGDMHITCNKRDFKLGSPVHI